jgi:hypothetical protein
LPSITEIARLLGGEAHGNQVAAPGPGHGKADRSLSVMLDPAAPEGFIVNSFAKDDPLACRDHVRGLLGLPSWSPGRKSEPVTARVHTSGPDLERQAVGQSLWVRSRAGKGSPAETYLASRGIYPAPWPETIRYLPANPPNHRHPTLIAAYGIPNEVAPGILAIRPAEVVGVQLTYLRNDSRGKAPIQVQKRSIGRGHTAPIVLAPLNDNLGLLIAEGIEDALSLHIETGLGAWAAGGAGRMPALADLVPECVDNVTIAADHNDAGRAGSRGLYERLRERGIRAEVIFLDQHSRKNGGRDGIRSA